MFSTPGGVFDAFIAEVSASMTASGTPGGAGDGFPGIAAKYGIEFLG